MKEKIAIYLAGSIKKNHERQQCFYWTDADMECIRENLDSHEVFFLNPDKATQLDHDTPMKEILSLI